MPPPRTIVEEAAARSFLSYPPDLEATGRNYYVEFDFYDYTGLANLPNLRNNLLSDLTSDSFLTVVGTVLFPAVSLIRNSVSAGANRTAPGDNIKLPMPRKINDTLTLTWGEISAFQSLTGAGQNIVGALTGRNNAIKMQLVSQLASNIGSVVSVLSGYSINPLLFMQFQRPNFRQFRFDWLLAPKNAQESRIIKNIVSSFKNAASPTKALGDTLLGYPQVALIKFYPDNGESSIGKHMVLKPCVIRGISVDYSPQGTPSFFKNTNAPTLIGVSLDLIEIQLWFNGDEGL
jgi:hypothetical protein